MKLRLALLTLLAATAAQAQLKLFLAANGTETPVTPYMNVGTAATGETLEIRLIARNTGIGPVSVDSLALDKQARSSGFSLYHPPDLPFDIAPGAFTNLWVRFQPTIAGTASAVFTINSLTAVLIAEGKPAPIVQTGNVTVSNGSVIDWGNVERGSSKTLTIVLKNLSTVTATVNKIQVASGSAFRIATPVTFPLVVDVNQSYSFDIVFAPTSDGAQAGSLAIDDRNYELRGTGIAPPLPQPALALDSTTASSSQQLKLRVNFAATSKASGSGTVQMQFKPATGLADDPTVLFLPAGRLQTVTVREGESVGRFGTSDSITFQTGTTAGQILFTIQIGGYSAQATLTIAPAAVNLDQVRATRESGRVVVQLTGFDNTRTADQLSFTFYDATNRFLGSGALRVSAGTDFQKYFQSSTAGGSFNLVATFPVTGNVSTIAAVEVSVTNSTGTTQAPRATF